MEDIFWRLLLLLLPPFLAIIITVFMGLSLCCFTADKLVRIFFPYIKRKGSHTVVYGFIMNKGNICIHFMLMVEIIIIILWIFFGNIIVLTTGDNMYMYAELYCYNINEITVESNTENETHCFGLDLNIGGAMGQAGGVLAFGWIFVSILTWFTLYLSHTCTCPCNFTKNKKFRACCKCGIVIIIFLLAASFLIGALSMTFFKWIPFTMQNYLQFGVFAAITISACLHCTNVDKMTPSLEKSCSETVMERIGDLEKWQKEKRNKLLLKNQEIS